MMQPEFDAAFERLQAAFEHPVKDATARLYYDVLRAHHADDWRRAVHDAIAEDDRWPRVGALLKRIRDYAVARHEREQWARAEAAQARAATAAPSSLGAVVASLSLPREVWTAGARAQRGEITAEEAEQIRHDWVAIQPPPRYACSACEETGLMHWEAPAPPGHPFAGDLYTTCGRCRCAAWPRWSGIPAAPDALQPTGTARP